jgi:hypothetical protein
MLAARAGGIGAESGVDGDRRAGRERPDGALQDPSEPQQHRAIGPWFERCARTPQRL